MELLDEFTYTATMHKIKNLKTLKSKEELARAINATFLDYNTPESLTKSILSYKAYCYLLAKCYPNYTEKLPNFITELKDSIGTELLTNFIKKEKAGEGVTPQLLDTFKYTDTLYYDIYDESDFFYLNRALKSTKFLATLVLNFRESNYVPFSTDVLQLPVKGVTAFTRPIFIIKPDGAVETASTGSYLTNTYAFSERSTEVRLDTGSLNLYLYLLTYNILPGDKSQYFYWETLAKKLYEAIGPEYLNLMEQAAENMTKSIKRSKQTYQLKEK